MQELVQYLFENLVDEPEKVSIAVVESGRSVTYEVTVAQDDLGKVIGRGGRIANALRTLVKSVPSPDDRRYSVEIVS